jgi:DNA-binding transcriptional LysR family regulator
MNFADIEAFVAVAETQSIAKASNRLHLSQPAITRRLQSLERHLGVELFDRDSRPMALTSYGQEAYGHAKTVLASANQLRASVTPGKRLTGDFRVGFSTSLGDSILEAPLDKLRHEFPQLRLHAIGEESAGLIVRIRRRELDAAVILLPEGHSLPSGIEGQMIRTDRIVFAVPKQSRLPQRVGLAELANEPWIVNPPGCSGRQALEAACDKAGLVLNIILETSGTSVQLALIEGGRGIGAFLPYVLKKSKLSATLRTIQPKDFDARISLWVVHHTGSHQFARPVEVLREALKRPDRDLRVATGRTRSVKA